ncbi:ATP-binding protein [Pseudoroseicyclus sp. H15]
MAQRPEHPRPVATRLLRRRPKLRSLRAKFALLVAMASLFSAIPVALATYRNAASFAEQAALQTLETEATILADRLEGPLTTMIQDAAVLAGTPPVDGIRRAAADAAGLDPLDGSSIAIWRGRLQTIFIALLRQRPDYAQIRYIGLADAGRELVRVDRAPDPLGIIARSPDELQQKAEEPYMRELAERQSLTPFFTEVSLNRENGRIAPGEVAMIRAIYPVANAEGQIFGAIVINGLYESLISAAQDAVTPGHTLEVDLPVPVADATGSAVVSDGFSLADGKAAYRLTRPIQPGGASIAVTAIAPMSLLLAPAREGLQRGLALAALLLCASLGGSLVAGFALTAPLRRLTQVITAPRDFGKPIAPSYTHGDEIGDLAAAFDRLTNDLIERTARAQAVLEAAADGIVIADATGTIQAANPAFCALFGCTPAELTGASLTDMLPQAGPGAPLPVAGERIGRHSSGEVLQLDVSVSETRVADRRTFIWLMRDISLRKAAEAAQARLVSELQRAKADLERSNDELDSFAYIASHDLKAPLRVIDNASRWLAEDLEPHLTDDTRESMEMLRGRVARMERLLDDLLEHSRIGRIDAPAEPVSGRQLFDDILALAPQRPGIEVTATAQFAALTLPRLPVHTILLNLVSNAIKHHDGPPGRVQIDGRDEGDQLVFTVEDDGPGIPPEFHEKVFAIFQTLRPRDAVEGSGIGLAIVRKHVEVAGGEIRLTSEPGRGSLFRVTLPNRTSLQSTEKAA